MGTVHYVNTNDRKKKPYHKPYDKKEEPFVDIVCRDVNYDYTQHELYNEVGGVVMTKAVDYVRKLYEDMQADEILEATDMFEDGLIDSLEDYDYMYSKPFNKTDWEDKIHETYLKYMNNVIDVPKDVVIRVDRAYMNDREKLAEIIGDLYKMPVVSIGSSLPAMPADILKHKTYEAVGEMYNSENYQTFLDLTNNLRNYSFNNIALIYSQRPDTEAVKSFMGWKQLERCVSKDEKGIMIWKPLIKDLKSEKEIDKYLSSEYKEGTASYEDEKKKLYAEFQNKGHATVLKGFTKDYVFDIKQTQSLGKEDNYEKILADLRFDIPLKGDLSNLPVIIESLEKTMGLKQGEFRYDNSISEQDGLYKAIERYAEEILRTKPETIVGIKNSIAETGTVHQLESKMTAYLICKSIGIECDDKAAYAMSGVLKDRLSDESIARGRREMFSTAYTRATKFAKQFNNEFEKVFEKAMENNKDIVNETTLRTPVPAVFEPHYNLDTNGIYYTLPLNKIEGLKEIAEGKLYQYDFYPLNVTDSSVAIVFLDNKTNDIKICFDDIGYIINKADIKNERDFHSVVLDFTVDLNYFNENNEKQAAISCLESICTEQGTTLEQTLMQLKEDNDALIRLSRIETLGCLVNSSYTNNRSFGINENHTIDEVVKALAEIDNVAPPKDLPVIETIVKGIGDKELGLYGSSYNVNGISGIPVDTNSLPYIAFSTFPSDGYSTYFLAAGYDEHALKEWASKTPLSNNDEIITVIANPIYKKSEQELEKMIEKPIVEHYKNNEPKKNNQNLTKD